MGEKIIRKVKGMSWTTKVSLMLVFTWMFSLFMYQGWFMPEKAMAATETLSPNAAGTNTTWTYTGGSADYTNLLTNDGDTTYATNTANNNVHTVNLQNPTGSGTITSVTTYLVAKGAATEDLGHAVVIGATTYADATLSACAEFNTTTAYATYSCTMATSPATGLAWTWAEVTGMQAGIEGDTVATAQYLTQVYVVVDYTADSTPPTVGAVTPSNIATATHVDATFDLSATLTDAESAVTTCQYCASSDGTCDTEWAAGTLSGSSPWTCTKTGITGFANGTLLTLNIRGTSGGGLGTGTAVTRTVDSVAPSYSWNTPAADTTYKDGGAISVDVSITEAGSGITNGATCNPKIDGGTGSFTSSVTYSTATLKCTGTLTLNTPSGLLDGAHNLTVEVADNVTNSAQSAARSINIDNTKPTVNSTVPTDGAIDVALNSNVTINWNENVDCGTVNTTNITSTSPGWTYFSCSVSQAIFTTSGQANSTTYNVNVTTAVKDVVGNPMAAAYPFSYTTVAAAVDTITIGQGTDPAAAPNLCPGTTGTYLDAFSLQVTSGAATTVTNVQVTTAGTAGTGSIAQVYLTDSGGTPIAGASSTTPAGNVWTLTPSTPLNVGTTATSYRIYVDLKAYASATAGTITGNVSGLGGTAYTIVDNDNASDTITVDKTAPADATWGTNTAGDGQVTLNWTKSNGADSVMIYMNTVNTDNTAPAGGTTYAVNDTIGTNTVKYVGTGTTTIITGLTNGTTYYFKIFEYDGCENYAGGVWSAGLTPAVGPNPLLHNSVNTASTKWGSAWGIAGGKYGEFKCETCHEPRATNIKGVKSTVTAPSDVFPGSSVTFNSITTAPNNMGDDSDAPRASSTRICEVCHTYDVTQASGVNTHAYNQNTNPDHYNAADCTSACHKHNVGFKKMPCDTCHGNPPTTTGLGGPTGLANDPGPTGSTTAGSHSKHAVTLSYACTTCHTNYAMPETPMQIIDIGFNMFNKKDGTGTTYGAANEVNAFDDYRGTNGTTIVDDNTRNCSNLYCHGAFVGGLSAAPTWGGAALCGTCHGKDATTPPTKINHPRHAGSGAGGLSVLCTDCHGVNAGDQSHVNGNVHWELNTGISKFGSGALYSGFASGDTGAIAPSGSYGACTNVYCHSNVQNGTGGGGPTSYGTPTWGGGALACSTASCHGNAPATPTANDAHGMHTTVNYSFACSACHNNGGDESANHANGTLNMTISATYGGTYSQNDHTPGSGGYGNCATVYCHGNYAGSGGASLTPSWAGAVACGDCHKYLNTNPPTPGSHGRHAGQAAGQLNLLCDKCHPSRALGDGHVNLSVQWQLSTGDLKFGASAIYRTGASGATGAKAPSSPYGTCGSVYCHSSVQSGNGTGVPLSYATPTWGGAVTCDSCHGQGPGVNDGSPSTGSHTVHVATYAYTCAVCHTGHGDETTTHANRTINLTFDAATAGGSATYTGDNVPQSGAFGNCTTTFCHGGSSNTSAEVGNWGTSLSAADACTVCHGTKTAGADGSASATLRAPGGNATGVDTAGDTIATDAQVGAHDTHLRFLNSYSEGTTAIPNMCNECHTVPAATVAEIKGHFLNGTPAEITWGTRATTNTATPSYASSICTNTYCHGAKMPEGSTGGSDTSPLWTDTAYLSGTPTLAGDCGKCHASPPVTASHTGSETIADCNACHPHVNTDGSFNDLTKHVDGIMQATGDCVGCHAGIKGARRAVVGEFALAWGHKKTGRGAVTPADCCVCHLEGNSTADPTPSGVHNNGVINLKDPDTGAALTTFTTFARNVNSNSIEAAVTNVQNNLCLKCHDSDTSRGAGLGGAASASARVPGGTATNPWNDGVTSMVDAYGHFDTNNASFHPVRGKQNNSYADSATMNAPWNGITKTPKDSNTNLGYLISCWDCHNATTELTTGSVTAHGNAVTLRAAYRSITATLDSTYKLGNPLCIECHKSSVYGDDGTIPATGSAFSDTRVGGTEADHTSGGKHTGDFNIGCVACHSSKFSVATANTPPRPQRAQDVHGFNKLVAGTDWPATTETWITVPSAQRPYAFLRNTDVFQSWRYRTVGQTNTTGTSDWGCVHLDSMYSACSNGAMQTIEQIEYIPGGAY